MPDPLPRRPGQSRNKTLALSPATTLGDLVIIDTPLIFDQNQNRVFQGAV